MPTNEENLAITAGEADATAATSTTAAELSNDDRMRAHAVLARATQLRAALDAADTTAGNVAGAFPQRVEPVVAALADSLSTDTMNALRAQVQDALGGISDTAWGDVVDAVETWDAETDALVGDLDDPDHPFVAADIAATEAKEELDEALETLADADAALIRAAETVRRDKDRLLSLVRFVEQALTAGDAAEAARWMIVVDASRAALAAAVDPTALVDARAAARGAVDGPLDDWLAAETERLTQALALATAEAETAVREAGREAAIEATILESLP